MRLLAADLAETLIGSVPKVRAALEGAELVVHHHMDVAAYAAAVRDQRPRVCGWVAGIPWVELSPSPHGAVRRAYRVYDDLYWGLQHALAEPFLNRVLEAAGLAPVKSVTAALWNAELVLLAIGRPFVEPRRSWPKRMVRTGFWFLEPQPFEPSAALSAFIDAGEPPVVVTLGSTALSDRHAFTQRLLQGISDSGRRAILVGGHAGLGKGRLHYDVLHCDYVPFEWLFARARSVIHHGGAGTTALAARAGIPQAVAWWISDQPRWGATLRRLGVGPRPVSGRELRARWVSNAIATCDTADVRARAARLRDQLADEDGVRTTVAELERHARRVIHGGGP